MEDPKRVPMPARVFHWIAQAVIGRMVFALAVTLSVAVAAAAQSHPEADPVDRYWPIVYAIVGGLISGAVQYGAVRQTIRDHDRRISEARDLAGKAHDRLYALAQERGR